MRTTLNISDALLEELKEMAAREKLSMRRTVETVLQRGLSRGAGKVPVQIEPAVIGVKPAYQGGSMNQLYDQLEAEELSRVAES